MMDIEKLIEDLRIACAGNQHNIMGVAATALSALQAENEKLRADVVRFNDLLASYQNVLVPELRVENENLKERIEDTRLEWYAKGFGEVIAEVKRVRAELEYEKEHANAYYEECGQWEAENENLRAELEQVKAERDAAIEYLREIEWCAGCKHFGGLDGCKKWAIGQCTEKNDLYEFVGPQKED